MISRKRPSRGVSTLSLSIVAFALFGCVKWGPSDHWHRPASGMELYLANHIRGYAECPGVYPGIEVDSAKLETSLLNGWVTADCRGNFADALFEAQAAAGFSTLRPPPGHVFKVILFSEPSIKCGKEFHPSDNCVSRVGGDVAVFVSWWTPFTSLRKALIALRDDPQDGVEWWGVRTSMDAFPPPK